MRERFSLKEVLQAGFVVGVIGAVVGYFESPIFLDVELARNVAEWISARADLGMLVPVLAGAALGEVAGVALDATFQVAKNVYGHVTTRKN